MKKKREISWFCCIRYAVMSEDGVPCLFKCAFNYRIPISHMLYTYNNYNNNTNRIYIKSINANQIYNKII